MSIETIIWVWFALTAASMAYMAFDLFTRTPEMPVMKWGWLLVALYTGPVALIVYWLSCREPAPGTHEQFVAPLWKQSVGSTIHCLAGDATGVIVAAAVTGAFGLPMWLDSVVEYVAGFLFGLFVFQALFMKGMLGGSYWTAVKRTWLAEWLSMNCVMAGMFAVMVIWMTRDMAAMEPSSPRFWFVMSMATLVGGAIGFPVNAWLVKRKLKHGMGTVRALGRGGAPAEMPSHAAMGHERAAMDHASMGHDTAGMPMGASVGPVSKVMVSAATIFLLAAGVVVADRFGNLTMRRSDHAIPQDHGMHGRWEQWPIASTTRHRTKRSRHATCCIAAPCASSWSQLSPRSAARSRIRARRSARGWPSAASIRVAKLCSPHVMPALQRKSRSSRRRRARTCSPLPRASSTRARPTTARVVCVC
ncbi:MAG TPA: DUF4396 domain-containing protein [Kofleriaceae bacterium]